MMSGVSERYLAREQNFFDQPPLRYVKSVADARQLELRRLRGLLPYIHQYDLSIANLAGLSDEEAKRVLTENQEAVNQLISQAAKAGITGRVRLGSTSRRPLGINEGFKEAFVEMALHLKDYPEWWAYLQEWTGQSRPWKLNGEPNIKGFRWYHGEQAPTYETWILAKQERLIRAAGREERIRRLEILSMLGEIFPQDSAGEAIQHPVLEENKRRKPWGLLQGANLLPEPGRKTQQINTKTPFSKRRGEDQDREN